MLQAAPPRSRHILIAAARRVYQAAGFTLDSEHADEAFGHQMMSQTWRLGLK